MAASFPTSAKTFTSRNAGDVIQPAHINDLQDEVNAIESGLLGGTAPLTSSNASVNVLTVTSGQIVFPAVQNASAGANTLDDYEEGTWTPSLGGNTTYTTQTGRYTKIGRMVFCEFNLTVNAIGTGSAGVISGLPFTAAIVSAGTVSYMQTSAQSLVFISCYASGTTITITGLAAAGTATGNPAIPFGNGTTVDGSVCFSV